jgi:leucyl/phenylalanyl-tRNA--protein transferase
MTDGDPAALRVRDTDGNWISPGIILQAYAQRMFPMADSRKGRFAWFRPEVRAVITLGGPFTPTWKIPDSLRKVMRREPYKITMDRAFPRVIAECANRDSTWISHGIERLYTALHQLGHGHSVEAWNAAGELVGGCYGLVLGGVFCGESIFHRADDAAKICIVHLVAHLQARGFSVLDCQQMTPHMARFGAYEISDGDYGALLAATPAPIAW